MFSKWKASKTPISSLRVDPSSKYLASASKTITIWELETRTKLKTLTGHSNDIFNMQFLTNSLSNLFVSAAKNDRIINMWSLESGTDAAQCTFTINDGPSYIDIACVSNDKESSAILCAVTSKGHLFIYNHIVTEKKVKKPVKAAHQLSVQTHEGVPLQILGAFVTNSFNERLESFEDQSELVVYVVYGSHVNPIIEKMVRFVC